MFFFIRNERNVLKIILAGKKRNCFKESILPHNKYTEHGLITISQTKPRLKDNIISYLLEFSIHKSD